MDDMETHENTAMPLNYAAPDVRDGETELGDILIELFFIGGFFAGLFANFLAICRIGDRGFRKSPALELCCEIMALLAFVMMIATLVTAGRRTLKRWIALWSFLGLAAVLLFCVYM